MKPIPDTVAKLLDELEGKVHDHLELARLCLEADGGNVHSPDLWVNASLRRSMQVLAGFTAMVRTRNLPCVGALLRVQLDTAARLFASSLVTDVDDFVAYTLKGGRIDRFKDRNGQRLTDRYLVDQLTKLESSFAWIQHVYESTSGFIHMSGRQMLVMAEVGDREVTISFTVHDDNWPEAQMAEAVDVFGKATDLTLWLVSQWCKQKSSYPATRGGAACDIPPEN